MFPNSPINSHDFIIIGGGIAGFVCAYYLARANKRCIILEKEPYLYEKVCGGGVPYKALAMLDGIGMDLSSLYASDINIIKGDCSYRSNGQHISYYRSSQYAIGTSRRNLAAFLMNEAISKGAEIEFHSKVEEVLLENGIYNVLGYTAPRIVYANGAKRLDGTVPCGQSIGISSIIRGKSLLRSDMFHFWYDSSTSSEYFWAFPISKDNIWNIGAWYPSPIIHIKQEYQRLFDIHVRDCFAADVEIVTTPRSAFIGHASQSMSLSSNYVGDAGGFASPTNGGGIYRAIKSAINYCNAVI